MAAAPEAAVDPMAEVPAELLQKPFKDLTKEERVLVARAKSRAMRAKSGVPVSSPDADTPAPAPAAAVAEAVTAPEPAAVEEAPVPVADAGPAAEGDGDDPMAEVPAELLQKPFKELSKEERVIVARARSRAVRARSGSA